MPAGQTRTPLFDEITAIILLPVDVCGLVEGWEERATPGAFPVEWIHEGEEQTATTEWRLRQTSRQVHAALYGDVSPSGRRRLEAPTPPVRSFHQPALEKHGTTPLPGTDLVGLIASELLLLRQLSPKISRSTKDPEVPQQADAVLAVHVEELNFGTEARNERGYLRELGKLNSGFRGETGELVSETIASIGHEHGFELALPPHHSHGFSLVYTNVSAQTTEFGTVDKGEQPREFRSTWGGGDPPHGATGDALEWTAMNQVRWALAFLNELPPNHKLDPSASHVEEADPGIEVRLNKFVCHITRTGLSIVGQERSNKNARANQAAFRGRFASIYLDAAILAFSQHLLLDQIAESVSNCSDPVSRRGRAIVRQQRTDLRRFGAIWWSQRMGSWGGPDKVLNGLQSLFGTEAQQESLTGGLQSYTSDIELDEQRFIGVILGVVAILGIVNVTNNALTGLAVGQGLKTIILGVVLVLLGFSLLLVVGVFRRWRSEPWRGSRIRS